MEKRVKSLNALAGAVITAAIMLAGTSSSFAAAAVSHPTRIVASQVAQADGAIVVAKKGKGAFVAGAIAGAVGAAIIANEAARADERRARRRYEQDYRPRHIGGSSYDRCADRFRSFRYSDGTYQPYGGGPREICPYLY